MVRGTTFRGTPALGAAGLPGRVWSLLVWFMAVAVILTLSLVVPMNSRAEPAPRIAGLGFTLVSIALLVVLRQRTPVWLLHALVITSIVWSLLITAASVTPDGAITSSLGLVALAAYVGFWVMPPASLAYAAGIVVGLVAAYAAQGYLPRLLVPCAIVVGLCLGLLLAFGTLVRQLDKQVVTDPLTGLLNRAGLNALISLQSRSGRVTQPRCVMVIDLDGLKAVNDTKGHLVGDRVLIEFSRTLASVIRPDDMAVRSGGDEFIVILPRTELEGADALAERLTSDTSFPWSHGVSAWPADEEFDAAVAKADRMMYEEKARRSGRKGDQT